MATETETSRIAALREISDIHGEVDRLMSEVNALAVAINGTALADDATQPGTISQKMLCAFGSLYDARALLKAAA